MGQPLDKPSRIATVASEGRVKQVKRSLSNASSIDIRNEDGRNALMLAVEHGHVVAVRTLLEAGADANSKELSHTSRRSVLLIAVEKGAADCLNILLQAGADMNYVDSSGQTCVMYAAKSDNCECLKALIKARANLDRGDTVGVTPLMLTVKSGNVKFMDILLQAGANPDVVDTSGQNCLMHAVKEGNCQSVNCLKVLLHAKANPNMGDKNGMTALMYCIKHRNLEHLQILLAGEAKPDVKDSLGRTALMLAAQPRASNIGLVEDLQIQLINALINAGADLNLRDYNGKTALMHAYDDNIYSSVPKLLRTRGADVNIPDQHGVTVLTLVVKKVTNSTAFLQYLYDLMESEVNLDVSDRWGKTALIHALELKDATHDKAVLLLQKGANPHTGPTDHLHMPPITPLRCCTLQKNFEKSLPERMEFVKYFIACNFLTVMDVKYRTGSDALRDELEAGSRSLLQELYSQPWPLGKLALIAVSSAIGPNPGREERVKKTRVPQKLQNLLLYQDPISQLPRHHWSDIRLCFNPREYETLPKARPLLHHWPFGREIVKCYCKKCQGKGLNFHGITDDTIAKSNS